METLQIDQLFLIDEEIKEEHQGIVLLEHCFVFLFNRYLFRNEYYAKYQPTLISENLFVSCCMMNAFLGQILCLDYTGALSVLIVPSHVDIPPKEELLPINLINLGYNISDVTTFQDINLQYYSNSSILYISSEIQSMALQLTIQEEDGSVGIENIWEVDQFFAKSVIAFQKHMIRSVWYTSDQKMHILACYNDTSLYVASKSTAGDLEAGSDSIGLGEDSIESFHPMNSLTAVTKSTVIRPNEFQKLHSLHSQWISCISTCHQECNFGLTGDYRGGIALWTWTTTQWKLMWYSDHLCHHQHSTTKQAYRNQLDQITCLYIDADELIVYIGNYAGRIISIQLSTNFQSYHILHELQLQNILGGIDQILVNLTTYDSYPAASSNMSQSMHSQATMQHSYRLRCYSSITKESHECILSPYISSIMKIWPEVYANAYTSTQAIPPNQSLIQVYTVLDGNYNIIAVTDWTNAIHFYHLDTHQLLLSIHSPEQQCVKMIGYELELEDSTPNPNSLFTSKTVTEDRKESTHAIFQLIIGYHNGHILAYHIHIHKSCLVDVISFNTLEQIHPFICKYENGNVIARSIITTTKNGGKGGAVEEDEALFDLLKDGSQVTGSYYSGSYTSSASSAVDTSYDDTNTTSKSKPPVTEKETVSSIDNMSTSNASNSTARKPLSQNFAELIGKCVGSALPVSDLFYAQYFSCFVSVHFRKYILLHTNPYDFMQHQSDTSSSASTEKVRQWQARKQFKVDDMIVSIDVLHPIEASNEEQQQDQNSMNKTASMSAKSSEQSIGSSTHRSHRSSLLSTHNDRLILVIQSMTKIYLYNAITSQYLTQMDLLAMIKQPSTNTMNYHQKVRSTIMWDYCNPNLPTDHQIMGICASQDIASWYILSDGRPLEYISLEDLQSSVTRNHNNQLEFSSPQSQHNTHPNGLFQSSIGSLGSLMTSSALSSLEWKVLGMSGFPIHCSPLVLTWSLKRCSLLRVQLQEKQGKLLIMRTKHYEIKSLSSFQQHLKIIGGTPLRIVPNIRNHQALLVLSNGYVIKLKL